MPSPESENIAPRPATPDNGAIQPHREKVSFAPELRYVEWSNRVRELERAKAGDPFNEVLPRVLAPEEQRELDEKKEQLAKVDAKSPLFNDLRVRLDVRYRRTRHLFASGGQVSIGKVERMSLEDAYAMLQEDLRENPMQMEDDHWNNRPDKVRRHPEYGKEQFAFARAYFWQTGIRRILSALESELEPQIVGEWDMNGLEKEEQKKLRYGQRFVENLNLVQRYWTNGRRRSLESALAAETDLTRKEQLEEALREVGPQESWTENEETVFRENSAYLKELAERGDKERPLFYRANDELLDFYDKLRPEIVALERARVSGIPEVDLMRMRSEIEKKIYERATDEELSKLEESFWNIHRSLPGYAEEEQKHRGVIRDYYVLSYQRMVDYVRTGMMRPDLPGEFRLALCEEYLEAEATQREEQEANKRIRNLWIPDTIRWGRFTPDVMRMNAADVLPVIRDYISAMDEGKGWSNVEELVQEARMLYGVLMGVCEFFGLQGQEFRDIIGEASSRIFLHLGYIGASYGMEAEVGQIVKMFAQEGMEVNRETGEKKYQQAVRLRAIARANRGRVGLTLDAMHRSNYWVALAQREIQLGDDIVPLEVEVEDRDQDGRPIEERDQSGNVVMDEQGNVKYKTKIVNVLESFADDRGRYLPAVSEGQPLTPSQHSAQKKAIASLIQKWTAKQSITDENLTYLPYERASNGTTQPDGLHTLFQPMRTEEQIIADLERETDKDKIKVLNRELRTLKDGKKEAVDAFELAKEFYVVFGFADQEGAPVVRADVRRGTPVVLENIRRGDNWMTMNDLITHMLQNGWTSETVFVKGPNGEKRPVSFAGLGEGVHPSWPRWGMGEAELRADLRNERKTDSAWLNQLRSSLKGVLRYMYESNDFPPGLKELYQGPDTLPTFSADPNKETELYVSLLDKLNELYDIARSDAFKEYFKDYVPTKENPYPNPPDPDIKYQAYQSLAMGSLTWSEIFSLTTSKRAALLDKRIIGFLHMLNTGYHGMSQSLALRNPVEMIAVIARSEKDNDQQKTQAQGVENYDLEIVGENIAGAHGASNDLKRTKKDKEGRDVGLFVKAVSSTALEGLVGLESARGSIPEDVREEYFKIFDKVLAPYTLFILNQYNANGRAALLPYMDRRGYRFLQAAAEFVGELPQPSTVLAEYQRSLARPSEADLKRDSDLRKSHWRQGFLPEGWGYYIASKNLPKHTNN